MDHERKGVRQLLSAFDLIRAKLSNVDLIIVGKPGSELTDRDIASPGVYFFGPRYGEEFPRLLASADLFMGASRYETFWFTPLEAMACGIPVVVSNAGAVPLMIPENGRQGMAVTVTDSSGHFLDDTAMHLAQAALPLLSDSARRIAMGHCGRSHVEKVFSEERLGQQLVEIFNMTAAA